MCLEVFQAILKSKTGSNLYMDDPDLYNKITSCVDIVEYQLSKQQLQKPQ